MWYITTHSLELNRDGAFGCGALIPRTCRKLKKVMKSHVSQCCGHLWVLSQNLYGILLGVLFSQEGQGRKFCWLMLILSSPLPQKKNHIAVALHKLKDKWDPLPADTVAVQSVTFQSSPDKRNCRLFTVVMMGRMLNWNSTSLIRAGFDFLVPGCAYKGQVCSGVKMKPFYVLNLIQPKLI